MRFWFSGPRFFGIRPGISLGPEDLRKMSRPASAAYSQPSSLIYVIKGPHDHVKIGISADPLARLANLQTASPVPLELTYVAAVKSGNGLSIEQEAHAMLNRHRQSGEWFDIAPEMAVAAIGAASHRLNDPIVSIPPGSLAYALELARQTPGAPPAPRSRKWMWAPWLATIPVPIVFTIACIQIATDGHADPFSAVVVWVLTVGAWAVLCYGLSCLFNLFAPRRAPI